MKKTSGTIFVLALLSSTVVTVETSAQQTAGQATVLQTPGQATVIQMPGQPNTIQTAPGQVMQGGLQGQVFTIAPPVELCADFSLFPDAAPFPIDFKLAAFGFHEVGERRALLARTSAGGVGLQFAAAGIGVTLPTAVQELTLRIAAVGGPVDVIAFDANFAQQARTTVPAGSAFQDVTIRGQGILYVSVEGGDARGLLQKMCVNVAINAPLQIQVDPTGTGGTTFQTVPPQGLQLMP